MKKRVIAVALLAAMVLTGCGSKGFTGTKKVELPYDPTGKKNDMVITEVEFKNGDPVAVNIDVKTDKGMKSELAAKGEYVMKEGEANSWDKQMDMLEKALVDNKFDVTKITLSDEDGHTDAVSGVTIKIKPYLESITKALEEAKK